MKFVYGFVAVASGLFTILNATNADRRWALGGFIVYIVALVVWVITTSGRRPRTDSARLRELARHSLDQAGDKPRTYTRSCLHDCATALVEVLDDRLCEGTLMHDLDRAKDRELAAMRTECAALRAALRKLAIDQMRLCCHACNTEFVNRVESHRDGCLAVEGERG